MRRPRLALGLLVVLCALAIQEGLTGSNAMPATNTAVYRSTTISGATLVGMKYTVTSGTITEVTARIQGVDLLLKAVTAQFGSRTSVVCTAGTLLILDNVSGLGEADYTCTGFSESADRPGPLTITVT